MVPERVAQPSRSVPVTTTVVSVPVTVTVPVVVVPIVNVPVTVVVFVFLVFMFLVFVFVAHSATPLGSVGFTSVPLGLVFRVGVSVDVSSPGPSVGE